MNLKVEHTGEYNRAERMGVYKSFRNPLSTRGAFLNRDSEAATLRGVIGDLIETGQVSSEAALNSLAKFVNLAEMLGINNEPVISSPRDKRLIRDKQIIIANNDAHFRVANLIVGE